MSVVVYSPTLLANGGPFRDWNDQSGPAARSIVVVNNSVYTFWFEAASSLGLIIPPGNQAVFPLAPSSSYRIYADPVQPSPIPVAMNVTITEQPNLVTGVIYTPLAPMNTQPGSSLLNPLYVTSTSPTFDENGATGNAVLINTGGTTLFHTGSDGLTTILTITLTVDTNGYVIFGSRVLSTPGNLPSDVWATYFGRVGIPFVIDLRPEGIFMGDPFVYFVAEHEINGASIAWTVKGVFEGHP